MKPYTDTILWYIKEMGTYQKYHTAWCMTQQYREWKECTCGVDGYNAFLRRIKDVFSSLMDLDG